MDYNEIKSLLKRTWNFLWNDDSLLSWLISIVLAFIIVKFIFFPLLSLIFAAPLPLVVVESGSMSHPSNFISSTLSTDKAFDTWWNKYSSWYTKNNITKSQAEKFPLRTGLEIGDIVIIYGRGSYKVGDIIIFKSPLRHPVIHRIVAIKEVDGEKIYQTKGDNNNIPGNEQFQFEKEITKDDILGKALLRIPKLGWVKLFFVKLFGLG